MNNIIGHKKKETIKDIAFNISLSFLVSFSVIIYAICKLKNISKQNKKIIIIFFIVTK
jgi:hypothetical protein